MQKLTGPRIIGIAVLLVAALAVSGCGGKQKRTVTTSVSTTVQAPPAGVAGGVAAGGAVAPGDAAANRSAGSAAAPVPQPSNSGFRKTSDKILAGAIGFGVLANGVEQTVADGSGVAGVSGQQCQNPYGTQAASNGQLICSSSQERLTCQCDASGCELVPTGIMSCLPVGAVYQ